MGCGLLAALVVGLDAYYSAQAGYLAQPPAYDGVGYMVFARTLYELVLGAHLRTVLHLSVHTLAPGWTVALAFQYLLFGAGPWQAFTVRFWPVALLLLLVYWVVRRRASRSLAIAATVLTALLPMISAGVRSAPLEFLTGQANYGENWSLDDLRPDIFAFALILWAVAILAEHSDRPTRSTYLASAAFAAAAVLSKPSTSPLLMLAWVGTLAFVWFLNRKRPGTILNTALGVALLGVILTPWAIFASGIQSVIRYLYETAVIYGSVYGTNDTVPARLWFFVVRIPTDLGPIEGWAVIAGTVVVTIALLRRRLTPAELIYGSVALVFWLVFALATARNLHLPEWVSAALWLYVWAGLARLAAGWRLPSPRVKPALLAAVGVYAVIVYGLGAFALANWPANEKQSNQQLSSVTKSIADELGRHITTSDCFSWAPGPGWAGSIEFLLMDANGNAPGSTTLDPTLTTDAYLESVKQCKAVIVYREDITQVAQAFYAPPAYQPYLRAVADWVRSSGSGYTLDRSWSFTDLPPNTAHQLGHYEGLSLTVDLYLRTSGSS